VTAKVAGVEVWLGNQKIGETETGQALVVADLPPGTYRIKARKPGYKAWEQDVTVAANAKAEVAIDIRPLDPPKPVKQPPKAQEPAKAPESPAAAPPAPRFPGRDDDSQRK
jgi:hypothetical protein